MTEDHTLIPSIGVLPSGGHVASNSDFHLSSMESKQTKFCTNEGNPGLDVTHKVLSKHLKIGDHGYWCESIVMDT